MKLLSRQKKKPILLAAILILAIFLPLAFLITKFAPATSAAWFDDTFAYRNAIAISSHTAAENNVYISVTIDTSTSGQFQADCGDLRFTKQNGEVLPYFISSGCTTATTVIHVFFDTFPAGAQTIYYYYGNPQAANGFSTSDFATVATSYVVGSVATQEKTVGPVAYWKFDEGYGATANNSTSVTGINGASTDVGTSLTQTNFLINFPSTNTWKKIHDSISTNTDVVTNYPGETTTYTRGVDYEIDYPTGRMRILSTGSMAINTNYLIDSTYSNTGVTWQSEDQCISGKCLFFDGADDSIQASANSALSMGPSKYITMQAWVKRIDDVNADNSYGGIITHNYFNPRLYTSGNAFTFSLQFADQIRSLTTASSYPAEKWYFVSASWDGTYLRIYVNGVLSATSPDYSSYTVTTTQAVYYIGRYQSGITRGILHGYIDEPKVYSYARSAAQIKSDFKSRGTVKGSSVTMGSNAKNNDAFSNGLVGYWKMDEISGAGSTLTDSSGNGNTGTAVLWGGGNTATDSAHVAGKYGNAFSFDGGDDYVLVADNDTLSPSSALTLSAWINSTAISSAPVIFSKQTSAGGTGDYYLNISSTGGRFYINGTLLSFTYTFSTSTWYQITAIYDATSTKMTVYINGSQVATTSNAPASLTNTTAGLYLGIDPNSITSTYAFNGKMDEARVYTRALSPKEVRDLYNWAPGPVAYWKLDEKTGTSAFDSSSNGQIGTLNGTATWKVGKIGSGVSFDSTSSSYISVADNSLQRATELTVSFWMYQNAQTAFGVPIVKSTGGSWGDGWGFYNRGASNQFSWWTTGYLTSNRFVTITVPTINTWHYVAGTFDQTNGAKLYIDGVLAGTATSTTAITHSTASLQMGYHAGSGGSGNGLNGIVDDVKIYNYARSQKQVVEDMNAGHPVGGSPVGSQVLYYKLDEGYGQTTYDSSPSQVNGSLSIGASGNQTTVAQARTNGMKGKFNRGVDFDGTDDELDVTYNSKLNLPSDFTFSFWVYNRKASGTTDPKLIMRQENYLTNGYRIWISTANKFQFATNQGGGTVAVTSNATLATGQWYHLAVTYSGTTAILYVNGQKDNSGTGTYVASTSNITIAGTGDSRYYLDAILDEIKIYNSALSSDEIALDYNRGSAMVLGSLSTDSASVASNSAERSYCVPGDSTSCSSPVGEWNFEEHTGANAYDTSGNGNTGTLTNSPSWTMGKVGSAVDFTGATNKYITVTPSGTTLDLTSTGTIESWVYTTSFDTWDVIVARGNWSGGLNNYSLYYNSSVNQIWGEIANGSTTNRSYLSNASTLLIGGWHHISFTWDGSFTRIYLDGKLAENARAQTLNAAPSGNLGLGNVSTSGYAYNGKLDQVRIFNYARTPAQIAYDYNRGGPVGWWKMDECQGGTANDSSGNGNSGTITIGATGGQNATGTCSLGVGSSAAWGNGATGKFNSSLNFDGTDDYVSIADANSLDLGDVLTASAWFKLGAAPDGNEHVIINKGVNAYMVKLKLTSGLLTFGKYGLADIVSTTTGVTDTTTWHHIVVTKNGSTVKMYLDGVDKTGTVSNQTLADNSTALFIGSATSSNYPFSGQIDDVRIYNYALTASQVKNLFNGGAAVRFGPATGTP